MACGQRREAVADLARRSSEPLDHGQHLHGGDESVSGRAVIGQDHVAGLLSAYRGILPQHFFQNIFVAHWCAQHGNSQAFERFFESEIRHHGGDRKVSGEARFRLHTAGSDEKTGIAIDQPTAR